jgi:hypothetical protein
MIQNSDDIQMLYIICLFNWKCYKLLLLSDTDEIQLAIKSFHLQYVVTAVTSRKPNGLLLYVQW